MEDQIYTTAKLWPMSMGSVTVWVQTTALGKVKDMSLEPIIYYLKHACHSQVGRLHKLRPIYVARMQCSRPTFCDPPAL